MKQRIPVLSVSCYKGVCSPQSIHLLSSSINICVDRSSSMERHGKRLSYPIIPGTRAGLDAVTPMTFIFLTTMEKPVREENSAIPTVYVTRTGTPVTLLNLSLYEPEMSERTVYSTH